MTSYATVSVSRSTLPLQLFGFIIIVITIIIIVMHIIVISAVKSL